MTTLAADNFNRADAGTLGANWTDVDVGWGISTNRALCAAVASVFSSRYTAVAFPNNQWAQCTIVTAIETASDQGCGPVLRGQAGGNLILVQCNTVQIRVYERIGGGFTQLGADGPAAALNDVIYAEIQGVTVVVKKNTVTVMTRTASGTIASGNAGIWGAPSSTQGVLDDWSAGDFLSGATPVINNPVGRRIVGYQDA